jgi:hypothetical protein
MMTRKIGVSCILAGAALLALTSSAEATGVGGFAGRWTGSDTSDCILEAYGSAFYNNNSCGGYDPCYCGAGYWYEWEVELPVNAGTYDPTIAVAWPAGSSASNYIECTTVSQPQRGSFVTGSESSGFSSPSGSSGIATWQPGSVTVSNNGFLYVACYMNYESALISVNY